MAQREEEVARLNARLGETESQLTQALTQPQSSAGTSLTSVLKGLIALKYR